MTESPEIKALFEAALLEDCAFDDVTARLIPDVKTTARVVAREPGVFSGSTVLLVARNIFAESVSIEPQLREGQTFQDGDPLVSLSGSARQILSLERTLLNFLGHACGVATLTQQFVEAVKPHPVKILSTRKTLPGLRNFQLEAVVAGGGHAHRRSLSDGILIKENHLLFATEQEMLLAAKHSRSPLHKVEIEVQDFKQLAEVLKNPPEIIMLDNFSADDVRRAVKEINGRAEIEVSGGMNLPRVREVAPLGIQSISIGQLTHSARWLNVSLDFIR